MVWYKNCIRFVIYKVMDLILHRRFVLASSAMSTYIRDGPEDEQKRIKVPPFIFLSLTPAFKPLSAYLKQDSGQCEPLNTSFLSCQAQPKPQPASPQLGAEIALFSQLWGTTLHICGCSSNICGCSSDI